MNKYFILDQNQMDKLQEGGGLNPTLLPKIAELENTIKKHLGESKKIRSPKANKKDVVSRALVKDPYLKHLKYQRMQQQLERLYHQLKTDGAANNNLPLPAASAPPPITLRQSTSAHIAPILARPPIKREEYVPPYLPTFKKEAAAVAGKPQTFGDAIRRGARVMWSGKLTSPRRVRSDGPPAKWATLEDAVKENPDMKRV